jgi:hypothetical protein
VPNAQAEWREIQTNGSSSRSFECEGEDCIDIFGAFLNDLDSKSYRKEIKDEKMEKIPIRIQSCNAHINNNVINNCLDGERCLSLSDLESHSITNNLKWKVAGVFGAFLGIAKFISCLKSKYNLICIEQWCNHEKKWSKWMPLVQLKASVITKKIKDSLIASIEAEYGKHANKFYVLFQDIDKEMQALDAFLKECKIMKNSWAHSFFMPDIQCIQEMEDRKKALSYFESVVFELLDGYDFNKSNDASDDIDEEIGLFLFDEE